MKPILLLSLVAGGCAGSAASARLAAEFDPALARGDVPSAVAAYERARARDDLRLRRAAEVVVFRALYATDAEVRERAVRIAVEVADPALDRPLAERLDDESPRIRARAAVALAPQLEIARARLEAILDGKDASARAIAVDGLGSLENPAQRIAKLCDDASPEVRARAASALAPIDRALARELAARLAHDPDAGVRAAAVAALGALGDRGAVAELEAALGDGALGVRLAALAGLTRLDGEPARLELVASRDDRFVALRAAVALAHRGRVNVALETITRAAADRRADARAAAMNAAGELGEPAAALISRGLRDPDLEVRLAAARALIAAGHAAQARPVLVGALDTPYALDAADELARIGDPLGQNRLHAAAASPDAATRRAALALIAPLPGALPSLTHGLADADPLARLTCAESLLRRAFRPYLR
ncbi:MAG TPA: HEAT repeat domain-containing protein [Polyangia bacterium]|nr:HEAT repeat domain-containing protein [Polyangia bacterium]